MSRLLLLLPQLPHDPTSGAARCMRTACEFLAASGWSVRALATTATEAVDPVATADFLQDIGLAVTIRPPNRGVYRHDRPVLEFVDTFGVQYQLLDTGAFSVSSWQGEHGSQFNRLFQRELDSHRPDVLLGFGGHDSDISRYRRAKTAGCKVVFGLRNSSYMSARWLSEMDAVLTCSEYQRQSYLSSLNLESTALPPPINLVETIATGPEPIFFTAINPSIEKGAFFLSTLAEELSLHRPDLPMLFIESRGSGGQLVQAGLAGGFDLRQHENLMFAPAVATPAEIFRGTRVLLVPSVCDEAFGRVAAEALLNGVPPIVSNRGGLPEAANGGGFVLPLPSSLTLETRMPVSADDVKPWLELMLKLADDEAFYANAVIRARSAGNAYRTAVMAPRYMDFFNRVAGTT